MGPVLRWRSKGTGVGGWGASALGAGWILFCQVLLPCVCIGFLHFQFVGQNQRFSLEFRGAQFVALGRNWRFG